MELSRRDFLKGGAAIGGAAALAGMVGCTPGGSSKETSEASIPASFTKEDYDNSPVELEPITKFAEEHTYDIVVVGAGTSGLPAVLTALEESASVACLQKESVTVAQGRGSSGVILSESTDLGIKQWKSAYNATVSYRCNDALLDFFIEHSGETLAWMDIQAERAGYPAFKYFNTVGKKFSDDSVATICQHFFGNKPENNNNLVAALAEVAKQDGAEFFFSTPAVQLVQDGSGAITGVVGKNGNDYIKFNANKGVILATGDYQNNDSLVARFSPDLSRFSKKQSNKTGDGILMCAAVGGQMVPVGHCKQMHDMDAGPSSFYNWPWLAVNMDGERFMNEELPMVSWNQMLRQNSKAEDPGRFCRIFDSNFVAEQKAWVALGESGGEGAPVTSVEALEKYIPGFSSDTTGVNADLIDTHRCDTLEELADELGVPYDALQKTVDRYNELCAQGYDDDFGKQAHHLYPIDTPPYWGIRQWMRVTAICGGIKVDGNYQVVDGENQPIPGLYAVGFGAGDLCGDVDWPLYLGGMSCGSCMTSGRYATIHAITGDLVPSKPADWQQVRGLYFKS